MNNPCLSCGCWDSEREGCTMPSTEMWYACPIESAKPENQEALRKLTEEYGEEAEEPECEVVVPHCTYGICTDYPHCAGCNAAEWKEVNTDGTVETDQGDL